MWTYWGGLVCVCACVDVWLFSFVIRGIDNFLAEVRIKRRENNQIKLYKWIGSAGIVLGFADSAVFLFQREPRNSNWNTPNKMLSTVDMKTAIRDTHAHAHEWNEAWIVLGPRFALTFWFYFVLFFLVPPLFLFFGSILYINRNCSCFNSSRKIVREEKKKRRKKNEKTRQQHGYVALNDKHCVNWYVCIWAFGRV